jgi:TRAP-type mannitol/chloroaromatic compound transport system permease small subunit
MFLNIASRLHRLTMMLCLVSLMIVLVSMTANVMLRHGLSIGYLKLQDLTLFAFGAFAILAVPVALADGRHVRVGYSNDRQAAKREGHLSLFVLLFFLLPMAGLLFVWSVPMFLSSVKILEGSGQIGGLGGVFIIKGFLSFAALLIAVQGIALYLRGGPIDDPLEARE